MARQFLRDAAKRDAITSRGSDGPRREYPRACRLVRRAEFDAVYREGRRRSGPSFTVFFRSNGRDISRFGLSVKKALGVAVTRNRIRRRIREILRLHRQEIAPGWDIVIHPRTSVGTAKFAAIETELLRTLPQAANTPGT
ncbi:MAG: ribonuclease P protein component [Candidatus Acidiferrales bacterium]